MVKKILIMPYFGEFPCYFDLWLHSCEMNRGTDFLVISDNAPPASIPLNVRWVQKSFSALKEEFQQKLGFKIWLKRPYKLCDFKGFYGYLFSEYLGGYDFWGYCDCDTIFGDFDKFLPESLFTQYDKLLRLGHLSLIRNTPEINENFRKYDTHKVILTSPVIYAYDEAVTGYRLGFAGELMDQGYRFYQNDMLAADIDYRHYPFRVVTSPEECCVFFYENGKLYKLYRKDGNVVKEEVMYAHLQKRKMRVLEQVERTNFVIYPNVFAVPDEKQFIEESFWKNASVEQLDYFDSFTEKWAYLKRDMLRFLYEPRKIDSLRYRFRK